MAETDVPDRDTLVQALAALERTAGVRLQIAPKEVLNQGPDTYLSSDSYNLILRAELKKSVQQASLGAVIHRLHSLPEKSILVADYITPNLANRLRQERVQFVDTAGNAYINASPLYVFISGQRKTKAGIAGKEGANRAFDKSGLKVVFAFLCDPDLVNATYRDIADRAGVALGTIGWVLNGLKSTGLVMDRGSKGRIIADYRKLLDRWVEAYPEKLRPKLHLGDFLAEDPHWWRQFPIEEVGGFWGSEVAAALYTDHLVPVGSAIYIPKGVEKKLLTKARLRKDLEAKESKSGNVTLYQTFWAPDANSLENKLVPNVVPPVLAYADLIASADPRNREVAGIIYDKYLAQYCQRN